MIDKKSFFYDFLILSGLSSFGGGLFVLYGSGITAITIGPILVLFGILGHYGNKK